MNNDRCEECGENLACECEHLCREGERLLRLCGACGAEHKALGHDCHDVRD